MDGSHSRSSRSPRRASVAISACLVVLAVVVIVPAAHANGLAPLVLLPDLTLTGQFGYEPPYPLNVPAFDAANMPVVRDRGADQNASLGVYTASGGAWALHEYWPAILQAVPDATAFVDAGGWESDRMVVTTGGVYYTALTVRTPTLARVHVLLRSQDGGATWSAYRLPFSTPVTPPADQDFGDFTYEHFVGHNEAAGPPTLAFWQRGARVGRWATSCKLFIASGHLRFGRFVLDLPVQVSRRAINPALVAGGGSQMVTIGRRTFIAYIEVARPGARGSRCYVATYDRRKRKIVNRKPVAYVKPDNLHCTPAICSDSRGYLHVVTGSHGASFLFTSSLEPARADCEWTAPAQVLTSGFVDSRSDADGKGRQTYVSLVCDRNDTLHVVSRQWRRMVDDVCGGTAYGALVHQRSRPNGRWSEPSILVTAPAKGYVNYYQKLAVDRRGRLFLSASVWCGTEGAETRSSSRAANRYQRRMLLVCYDGVTWRLASQADLLAGKDSSPAGQ